MDTIISRIYSEISAYESSINFSILIGEEDDIDIATESSIKNKIVNIGNKIKQFFRKIWEVLKTFFANTFIGEDMVDGIVFSQIKSSVNVFTEALNEECLRVTTSRDFTDLFNDITTLTGPNLDNVLVNQDKKIKLAINEFKAKSLDRDYIKSADAKKKAVKIDVCKNYIRDVNDSLRKTVDNVQIYYLRHAERYRSGYDNQDDSILVLQKKVCEIFVSTVLLRITAFYAILTLAMRCGAVRFYAKDIKDSV